MKRKIIHIDEEKCNGCGQCSNGCPEGAIQIIKGKARLINDLFCDGLGACIGTCPQGAITIEEREAVAYDEKKTMENISRQGIETIQAHLKHLAEHGEKAYLQQALEFLREKNIKVEFPPAKSSECGCPGSKAMDLRYPGQKNKPAGNIAIDSQLQNWPIQLKLISPIAPYFNNAELVIAADCVPFAYADFHRRFLSGKILINFCPKLDADLELYVEKLTNILKHNEIKSITLVHMEVSCCFGLIKIVEQAVNHPKKCLKRVYVQRQNCLVYEPEANLLAHQRCECFRDREGDSHLLST